MSDQQQGVNVRIIFDSETTFKSDPVVPDALVLPYVSESLRMSRNLITSNTIRSDRNPQKPVRGNEEVAGDISIELAPQYGRLLRHIFGTEVVTSGAGLIRTHTYTIGNLPTGMVIEKGFDDLNPAQYFKYNGCRISQFSFSGKAEGMIDCSVTIMGAKETTGTSSFDETPRDLGHTPFDGFEASVAEGATTLGNVTQIDFTIDNNLDGDTYVIDGTGERHSLPAGWAKVTGTVTALFDSMDLYNRAVNHEETSITLHLTKGNGDGASPGNEKLSFYFDEVVFSPNAPVVSGPTGVVVELPFEAYYNDDAEASAIRAVLLVPSYTF